MVKTEHSTQHVALVAAQKLNLSECSLLFSSNGVVLEQLDGCISSCSLCSMCDSVTGYTFFSFRTHESQLQLPFCSRKVGQLLFAKPSFMLFHAIQLANLLFDDNTDV